MLQPIAKAKPKTVTQRPKFGQRIKAKSQVVKHREFVSYSRADYGEYKVKWGCRRGPVEGIYIGYRYVFEGTLECYEDHDEFHATERVRVWLIVENERKNPIHVLPEDVIWEE